MSEKIEDGSEPATTPTPSTYGKVKPASGSMPRVGDVCNYSGANMDIKSDQYRAFVKAKVISIDGEKITLQKDGCHAVVEFIRNCHFRIDNATEGYIEGFTPTPSTPADEAEGRETRILSTQLHGQARKRPITIDWCEFQNRVGEDTRPEWIKAKQADGTIQFYNPIGKPPYLLIGTLEGVMLAEIGDIVVRGIKGEIYPIKPDIFRDSYDVVNDSSDPSSLASSQRAIEALKMWADWADELDAIDDMNGDTDLKQQRNYIHGARLHATRAAIASLSPEGGTR